MKNWLLYTSTDMVNWQDHGAVASLQDFKWAKRDNGAWAEQVIERNSKWYMYCPLHGNGIGVYQELSTPVKNAKGVHNLYLVFKGGDFQQRNLFYLDWWEFGK